MAEYTELIKALRCCGDVGCHKCPYQKHIHEKFCWVIAMKDAADAIEDLQAEVKFYKNLAEEWREKERLLGMYRAQNMYSAKDKDGHLIVTQCDNVNRSENPNT